MIDTFIENNNISFEEGNRNSSVTTMIGYAQHLNLSQDKLKAELIEYIDNDSFIKEEIDRLWSYCNSKNYKSYWSTDEAKKTYKF